MRPLGWSPSRAGARYTKTLEAVAERVGDAAVRGELDARRKELRLEAADAVELEVPGERRSSAIVSACFQIHSVGTLR